MCSRNTFIINYSIIINKILHVVSFCHVFKIYKLFLPVQLKTHQVPPHNLVLFWVDLEEREHVRDGSRRAGAAEHDVQQHPFDGERSVVE